MVFSLNSIVTFDMHRCLLVNSETNDEINLPATAACILSILLDSSGGVLERNTIIEKVWERFSFDLSNNTLNQYISLLRKNMRLLGLEDDVIITVPKVGFCINENVMIEKRDYPANQVISKKNVSMGISEGSIFKKYRDLRSIMLIAAVVLVIDVMLISLHQSKKINNYDLVLAGMIGKCPLYLSENLKSIGSDKSISEARQLSESYLPCTDGSEFIFDVNSLHFATGLGNKYLARCFKIENKDEYAFCSEVLIHEQ